MTTIKSEVVTINASPEKVYTFLSDLRNYELLLPRDSVSEWSAEESYCSFKIQQTYKIELHLSGGEEFTVLKLTSGSGSPVKFTLDVGLKDETSQTIAQLICNADVNPFLKMMVEKPLKNLFNYMADRMLKVEI